MLNKTSTEPGVELSTVHRVKGREWNRVIVFDASARLMPHERSNDRAEERRIFHVALTRCRDSALVLTDDSSPSPFLEELEAPGEPDRSRFVSPRRETTAPAKTTESGLIIDALKAWRRETSKELKSPAFTIFHDAQLEDIAAAAPTTLKQLAKCKGVGSTKLDRWGDEVLAVIEEARS